MNSMKTHILLLSVFIGLNVGAVRAAPMSVFDMDIEQLMNLEVTSVSRKKEKAFRAASALFVINREDIRRSTATSVPELLRIVPGLQVARIDSNRWAISARGFNGQFANKLLVLVDGRTVYTPLFSGVYWDEQILQLEEIERIEVIRGPGAAMWGANAVNGVISITTRNANDTTGGLLRSGGGNVHENSSSARYGVKLGENSALRIYGGYDEFQGSKSLSEERLGDDWRTGRVGARADLELDSKNTVMLQGQVFDGDAGTEQILRDPNPPFFRVEENSRDIGGGHIMGNWSYAASSESTYQLQAFYDRISRDGVLPSKVETGEVEFQHQLSSFEDHSIVWGLGAQVISDSIEDGQQIRVTPQSRTEQKYSLFVNDEISLVKDTAYLSVGTKLEENGYTGFEIQPSMKFRYHPTVDQTIWVSASRAVHTPSRTDDDIIAAGAPVTLPDGREATVLLTGSRDVSSEELLTLELGYRSRLNDRALVDLALFYSHYDDLRTFESGAPIFDPNIGIVIPSSSANEGSADSYGIEALIDLDVTEQWRLQAGYTVFTVDTKLSHGSRDTVVPNIERQSPRHSATLRSLLTVCKGVEFDGLLRYVDSISQFDIDSYLELDLRVGWKILDNLELSITGNNLLHSQHGEYGSQVLAVVPAEFERGVFGKLTFEFE